jgi:hypothetical protein
LRKNLLRYAVILVVLSGFLGMTACSKPAPTPGTIPSPSPPVEEPELSEPAPILQPDSAQVPTPEPSESLPPQPTLGPDSQTITLASAPRLFSSILPSDFKNTTSGTTEDSSLLGIGSSEYFTEGELLSLGKPWCQVQYILWVVDNNIAQQVTAEDILREYGLQGNVINLEDSSEAILSSEECSGINFLVIRYGRVFVMIDSFYCYLQKDFTGNLTVSDMDIINNWLSANDTLLPYATGSHDVGVTGNINLDIARAVRDITLKG